MKDITIDNQSREILIDGEPAGVGWTAKMEKDIEKFGKKIIFAVTKCMLIKMQEKYDLNLFETIRLKNNLRYLF